jgi:hypothetical protein
MSAMTGYRNRKELTRCVMSGDSAAKMKSGDSIMTGKKTVRTSVGKRKSGGRKTATAVRGATVPQILRQIDQLSEPERLRLHKTLAQRVEAEWLRKARRARRVAAKRGIDQSVVDRAVDEVRYRQVNGDRG